MIIECLEERAAWRRETYGISKKIDVINNTIPKSVLDNTLPLDDEYWKKIKEQAGERFILLYAGRAGMSRNLLEVLNCIPRFTQSIYFLFYCYGNEDDFSAIYNWESKNIDLDNYQINKAISRNMLLSIMRRCDIGINYYDPDISINHRYAAPSKFFEYIGCGLNVISTNNIGINRIINENGFGICLSKNETISDGLIRLLNKGLNSKEKIINSFLSKYEYSIDSKETIDKIKNMIYIANGE